MSAARATTYPIRVVARMTGLSLDTLRAWERRYQAVVPERGDRGRIYTARHVARLKLIAALVERGHAIGSIAALSDAELRRHLLLDGDPAAPATSPSTIDVEPLMRAVRRYELPAIDAELTRHALLLPPVELIFGVILPVLRELGSKWAAGSINPAQEHLVSSIIRGILGGMLRAMPRQARARGMVFAAPSGDLHELGLLCGAVLAAASGQAVLYLGSDLPAVDIAHAVRQSEAAVLVICSTIEQPGNDFDAGALRRLPRTVDIWVGGARADQLRSAIGSRARQVESLHALRRLCEGRG